VQEGLLAACVLHKHTHVHQSTDLPRYPPAGTAGKGTLYEYVGSKVQCPGSTTWGTYQPYLPCIPTSKFRRLTRDQSGRLTARVPTYTWILRGQAGSILPPKQLGDGDKYTISPNNCTPTTTFRISPFMHRHQLGLAHARTYGQDRLICVNVNMKSSNDNLSPC
jgi:hypothetical protein